MKPTREQVEDALDKMPQDDVVFELARPLRLWQVGLALDEVQQLVIFAAWAKLRLPGEFRRSVVWENGDWQGYIVADAPEYLTSEFRDVDACAEEVIAHYSKEASA